MFILILIIWKEVRYVNIFGGMFGFKWKFKIVVINRNVKIKIKVWLNLLCYFDCLEYLSFGFLVMKIIF